MRVFRCNVSIIVLMVLLVSSVHGFFLKSYRRSHEHKRTETEPISSNLQRKLFFKKNHIPDAKTVVNLYGSVKLICEANGMPGPTIHWLFNGQRIPQSDFLSYDDDTATYEDQTSKDGTALLRMSASKAEYKIDCADESRMGEYTCIAETPFQRIYTSTLLYVIDSEEPTDNTACLGNEVEVTKPPHIYMWTSNRLEFEGATVQLFCRAKGSPTPLITWYDRDRNVIESSDPHYEILGNGDLLVRHIAWSRNMGRFRCEATNEIGDDDVTTFLYPTFNEKR